MEIDYEKYKSLSARQLEKELMPGFVNEKLKEAFRRLVYFGGDKKPFGKSFSIYRLAYCYLANNLKELPEDVDFWISVCDLYHNCPDKKIKSNLGGLILKLVTIMLDNDLYVGVYRDKLDAFKVYFKGDKNFIGSRTSRFLCGKDIVYLYYVNMPMNNLIRFIVFKLEDSFLREIFLEFLEIRWINLQRTEARDYFLENANFLFEGYINKINKISDIDYAFYHAVEIKLAKENNYIKLLQYWNKFFKFLLNHPSGEGKYIFKERDPLSIMALAYNGYASLICEGYEFVYYNPMSPVPASDRWVLCITAEQSEIYSRNVSKCKKLDFEKISKKIYRNLVKEYLWDANIKFDTKDRLFYLYVYVFGVLSDIKRILKTSDEYISREEVVLVRQHIIQNKDKNKYQVYNYFKMILDFAVQKCILKVDKYAFYGLHLDKGEPLNKAKAIPDEHMERLNEYFFKKSSESIVNFYLYVIFHMLYQSEFRISQICDLQIGCISHVEQDHNLVSIGKTSNGEYYEVTVTDFFKDLIKDVENVSASVRAECYHEEYKRYLFLYKNDMNLFVYVRPTLFTYYLKKCCRELGLPMYTSGNIRDTHMTKAHEYRLRKNISEAAMKVLTGHRSVDTTVNYYIEDNLKERLLFMSDKIIGDVDIDGVIVAALPDKLKDKKHNVEYGCGACSLDYCADDVFYNCFTCKHFYTTVDMLPRFMARKVQLEKLLLEEEEDFEALKLKLDLINQWIFALENRREIVG